MYLCTVLTIFITFTIFTVQQCFCFQLMHSSYFSLNSFKFNRNILSSKEWQHTDTLVFKFD